MAKMSSASIDAAMGTTVSLPPVGGRPSVAAIGQLRNGSLQHTAHEVEVLLDD